MNMNMNIKLTPFLLFLIILGVLVVSMLVGNKFNFNKKEGFISFQNNDPSTYGQNIYIPQYSTNNKRTVISLYDNLYFDSKNGGIIEVDAPSCSRGNTKPTGAGDPKCNDTTGEYITTLFIIERVADKISTYKTGNSEYVFGNIKPNDTSESLNNKLLSLYNDFTYTTKSVNTNTYQLFYISWKEETYIHIMDIENKNVGSNVVSYLLNSNGIVGNPVKHSYSTVNVPLFNSKTKPNIGNKTATYYKDENYFEGQNTLYELSPFVKYDYKNGYILITEENTNKKYTIYPRDKKGVSENNPAKKNTIINQSGYNVWSIPDGNNGMVMVMMNKLNTIICIINSMELDNKYQIITVGRFTKHGLEPDKDDKKPIYNKPSVEIKSDLYEDEEDDEDEDEDEDEDIYKKKSNKSNTLTGDKASDFLKSDKDIYTKKSNKSNTLTGDKASDFLKPKSGITPGKVSNILSGDKASDFLKSESGSKSGKVSNTENTPIDNYSYFGALPSKGDTDYLPIITDFSAFRK